MQNRFLACLVRAQSSNVATLVELATDQQVPLHFLVNGTGIICFCQFLL